MILGTDLQRHEDARLPDAVDAACSRGSRMLGYWRWSGRERTRLDCPQSAVVESSVVLDSLGVR
jgi:hypothetical protein